MTRAGDALEPGEAPIGTLERGLAILDAVASLPHATAPDIAARSRLSRSTTYRLIERLRELGYLEVEPETGRVRLGLEVIQLGVAALQASDIMRVAPPALRQLSVEAGASTNLAVFDVDRMVLLHREQGDHALTVSARLGSHRPMQASALGKAYLAAMAAPERERVIARLDFRAYAPASISDAEQLRMDLHATEQRGYAIDRSEFERTLACCAAVVFDHRNMPVAAISISGLAEDISPQIERLGAMVAATAQELSARLGHRLDKGARRSDDPSQ